MDSMNSLMVYHQSFIYYTAISLLFHRVVKMEDPHELQDLVSSGINHIEIYEEISKESTGLGLFWPAFVVCCEATSPESQARVEEWLKVVGLYSADAVRRGSRIIKMVWDKREGGEQVSRLTCQLVLVSGLKESSKFLRWTQNLLYPCGVERS